MKTVSKIPYVRLLNAFTVVGLLGCASQLAAQNLTKTWDAGAGTSTWLDAANWNNDSLPATGTGNLGDNLQINNSGAFSPIYSAATGTNTYRRLTIGDGASATGIFSITGGTFGTDNTAATNIGSGTGANGTLNVSGGTASLGGTMEVGRAGGTGTVNISGGTLTSARNSTLDSVAGVSVFLGNGNATVSGALNLTGGTFITRTGAVVGNSTGGVGVFSVGGAGLAQIGHNNATDSGFWHQRATGTLKATVDSTAFTLGSISIFDASDTSYLTFDSGSKLEVGFSGVAPSISMTWNLMTYETGRTVTNNGLTLVGADITNWGFAFTDIGGGLSALQLTYTAIPEPSSFAVLAGLGVLGLVASRRRRAV